MPPNSTPYNPYQDFYGETGSQDILGSATTRSGGGPTLSQELFSRYGAASSLPQYNTRLAQRQLGQQGAAVQSQFGIPAQQIGLANLMAMLGTQGRQDPRIMGAQLRAADRGIQTNLDRTRGSLASGGWGNLGLGKALQAAQMQGGENLKANIRYQDEADAYARQQANLGLLGQLSIDPTLQYAGIAANQQMANKAARAATQAAAIQAIGSVIGGVAGACKVARELYGEDSDKFKNARMYVVASVPANTSAEYIKYGEEIAAAVKVNPELRKRLEPIFDVFAERGSKLTEAKYA